jgi:YidC/Oxa1 family membrane protein insertase
MAMVLAVLVLVLNTLFFGSRQKPAPERSERVESAEGAPPPAIEAPPAHREAEGSAGAEPLKDREQAGPPTDMIAIETDLVEAVFDPVGATVRAWKLKQHTDAAGQPADLVRSRDLGALWFAIRDGARTIRTDSTVFRAVQERDGEATVVRFVAEDTLGLRVEKSYRISPGRYDCAMQVRVVGAGADNDEGFWEIGWVDGLPIVEKDAKTDRAAIASLALFGKDYIKTHGGSTFGCAGPSKGAKTEVHDGTLSWFGVRNRYFLGALLLEQPRDRRVVTSFDGSDGSAGAMMREPLSLSGATEQTYRLYLGPIHYGNLESYKVGLERVQDLGPGILRPFSRLLMKFFEAAHHVVPNYGWEIIILSVLIRILFYPLSKKSMASMRQMQLLKPELDRLQEKYKDDAQRRNQEVLELYRRKKINPLGGCLPMVAQLPVLSGLYFVLANAVQLRKEPFVLWMTDLSAPDTVAHIAGFPVNIMPLLMAGTMFWQQKLTPTDPRQASMGYVMTIFMTFLFYSMSSGLVVYWTVSNLMTVLQQIWIHREIAREHVSEETAPVDTKQRGRR